MENTLTDIQMLAGMRIPPNFICSILAFMSTKLFQNFLCHEELWLPWQLKCITRKFIQITSCPKPLSVMSFVASFHWCVPNLFKVLFHEKLWLPWQLVFFCSITWGILQNFSSETTEWNCTKFYHNYTYDGQMLIPNFGLILWRTLVAMATCVFYSIIYGIIKKSSSLKLLEEISPNVIRMIHVMSRYKFLILVWFHEELWFPWKLVFV